MGNFLGGGHDYKAVKVADDECKDLFKVKRPFYTHIPAFFLDVLEKAFLWFFNGKEKIENHYMLGDYAPVDEFGPERVLSVKGQLPKCLNGDFVRVGPNPKWKPVAKYHWFDGAGMLHGLRIKDGNATYVCRYVRTSRYAQEEYWGGPKFCKIGDLKGKKGLISLVLYQLRQTFGIIDTSNGMGTANTAMIYHNGKLQALHETDAPYVVRVLEDGDLETVARLDYDKKLNHAFTAHPKIDPETGEMFAFGYQVTEAEKAYVTYRVISKDGAIGDCVHITLSGPIMMHDFAITESYAIFMDLPLYFNLKDMVKRNGFVYSFDETKPARFGVLPRYAKDESQIHWFELSTCFIFHTANAWEEGDEVVLIACRSPSIDLEHLSVHDERKTIVELWEYRFNMKTADAKERQLGKLKTDFPRINEEYLGRKTRFVYAAVFGDSYLITGVVKYDLAKEPNLGNSKLAEEGNVVGVYWHGSERYGSEPVYVPKKPGRDVDEDDGYLLNFVFDKKTLKSEVVVLNAKTMSSDPVAVIELPARVPVGFHALFVTEEQLQSQRA